MQSGIAQRSHLHLSFGCVTRRKARFRMAGVTVEFRYAVPDLFVQEPQEPLDADLVEMRLAAPLTIELREVPDLGVTPHRHSHVPAPGDQGREDLGVAMQVVVRVHVCRRGADELHESRVLALDLGSNVFGTDCIQLQVEPKAEFGATSSWMQSVPKTLLPRSSA